uniref:Uncharacterized protein LOC104221865 n=1 Tax=Nicotiana sylvestris TaxID=4096 RepID=A0A1U7W9H5_NICSY|nr:PREDICTED: uncharacterized protein LOC104221865 [Nicotiana sylvestris]
MRTVHSTWPVILVPYNLPPWMCMKQEFFILSLLIPGPKAPGNNIDVFLQPLIEELNELWDVGVEMYDASTKEIFQMRAVLMWTINDFQAYGTLSGCKEIKLEELKLLEENILETLSTMEKLFLPGFFTVMIHLVIHLATESKDARPVHYRWMYPIERRFNSRSIHSKWVYGILLTIFGGWRFRSYCSRKCSDEIEHETSKEECLFPTVGESYGGVDVFELDEKTWLQAHREHIVEIKRAHRKHRLTQHQLDRMHFDTFHEWFKEQVKELEATSNILKDVKVLAQGPSYIAKRFSAFDVNNDYRFRMKQSEEFKVTQNSVVMVVSKTESYASTSDNAPKSTNIIYYSRLNDIVELNYYEKFKVILFKCDWVDVTKGRGIKEDNLGFTLVNFSYLTDSGDRQRHEPFIFIEQAQQVIFVQDPQDHEWFVPRLIKLRDIFNMGGGK